MSLIVIARWVHVLAAAAWLGEVATVVLVLVPAAIQLQGEARASYLSKTFPPVFRLASVLALLTLAAGALLNYLQTGWRDLSGYLLSTQGKAIVIGGFLGLGLALFHFAVEARIEPRVRSLASEYDETTVGKVSTLLRWVPRLGLGILLVVLLLMMIGSHGV